MSTHKLDITYDFDFDLIGLVCTDRDYKLAWRLNELLSIQLVRSAPVEIAFSQGQQLLLSVFDYQTENDAYQLLRNRGLGRNEDSKQYLLPELKELDYFLRIDNHTGSIDVENIMEELSNLSNVQYCTRIKPNALKEGENLFF